VRSVDKERLPHFVRAIGCYFDTALSNMGKMYLARNGDQDAMGEVARDAEQRAREWGL